MIFVSACLAGYKYRYDGCDNLDSRIMKLVQNGQALPACPEILGGLSTPRTPAEIRENRVTTIDDADLTDSFYNGAQESLKLCKMYDCNLAILKSKSPSCGRGLIYDGYFSGKLKSGNGITSSFLIKNGITVVTEEEFILYTDRLVLRKLNSEDYEAICDIIQDEKTMYAYEGALNDEEARLWLDKQLKRYEKDGFGLWAVILRETGLLIGQAGISTQDIDGESVPEIGYLFNRKYWHKGYAIEVAKACKQYGFSTLGMNELYTIIRDTNLPSMNVAIKNGMTIKKKVIRHFRGIDMPHFVFSITK